jgi:uncharacterized protein (TIGR04255 family)
MSELPKYENPPINELVVGVRFPPVLELIAPYWGGLWDRYKSEFPHTEQHPPLPSLMKMGQQNTVAVAPSRIWFVSEQGHKIIQIQPDVFFYNWRQLEDGTYPGYEILINEFWQHFEVFRLYVEELGFSEAAPGYCELSYIDLIPLADEDNLNQLADILPDFTSRKDRPSWMMGRSAVKWETQFYIDEGHMSVQLANAHRLVGDLEQGVLRAEMSMRGEVDGADVARDWFDRAHSMIVKTFEFLIDEQVQHKWGKYV